LENWAASTIAYSPKTEADSVLYLVGTKSLPNELSVRDNCVGTTSGCLDLLLRPRVCWKGRGPAILVNDGLLAQMEPHFLSVVVIHELAHIMARLHERGQLWAPGESPRSLDDEAKEVFATVRSSSNGSSPPMCGDCDNWIRAVLHLRHRAVQDGDYFYPERLFTRDYGLTNASFYVQALYREFVAKVDSPIAEILRSEPPEGFQLLWEHDFATYVQFSSKKGKRP